MMAGAVADLERRLAALEQTTGAGGAELPQDLATMVRGLSDRVSLLDKSALQKLTKEVTDATRLMHEASQRKDRLNHEQTEQIGKVAAAVTKWSPVAEELPMIVERLYQLKRVHAQAAQYAGSVKSITDEQTAISGGLKSQDALLRQVQASLQENIKTMSGNIKALEARFDKAKLKK
jgi:type VI protein secretion system component VasK|eukprot:SAG25_NODE_56_length_18517_cov_197.286296_6_plen_177_part_00